LTGCTGGTCLECGGYDCTSCSQADIAARTATVTLASVANVICIECASVYNTTFMISYLPAGAQGTCAGSYSQANGLCNSFASYSSYIILSIAYDSGTNQTTVTVRVGISIVNIATFSRVYSGQIDCTAFASQSIPLTATDPAYNGVYCQFSGATCTVSL
jgi:hypothetical protein